MTLQEVLELNIFNHPSLRDLPYAEKEKLGKELVQEIMENVAEEIEDRLPEDKAKEFEELFLTNNSPEARARFLNENVPDFEEILVYETLVLKEDFKKFMDEKTHTISRITIL